MHPNKRLTWDKDGRARAISVATTERCDHVGRAPISWQAARGDGGESAERWAEHEADPETGAKQAEVRRPLSRRRHVDHIGVGDRNARRRDPGDHAAEEQPIERGRERHHDIVEAEPDIGDQDDGPRGGARRRRERP